MSSHSGSETIVARRQRTWPRPRRLAPTAGDAHAEHTIPGLAISAGSARVWFDTDAPGVPESTAPGARALTYALHNHRVD
jgi:hypothetical protein